MINANDYCVVLENAGTSATEETQSLSASGTPTGGTFVLTFQGYSTGDISYNARAAAIVAFFQRDENKEANDYLRDNLPAELTAKYGPKGGAERCFILGIKEACNDMEKYAYSTPFFKRPSGAGGVPTWVYVSAAGVVAFLAYRHFAKGK